MVMYHSMNILPPIFEKDDIIYYYKFDSGRHNTRKPIFYKVVKVSDIKTFVKPLYSLITSESRTKRDDTTQLHAKQACPIDQEVKWGLACDGSRCKDDWTVNMCNQCKEFNELGIKPGRKSFFATQYYNEIVLVPRFNSSFRAKFHKYNEQVTWNDVIDITPF